MKYRLFTRAAALLPMALPALASASALSYYVATDGNAETRLVTNSGLIDQKPSWNTGNLAQVSVTQSQSSSQDGVDGSNPGYAEHADASAWAMASIGALHATVSGNATTSPNWGPGASLGGGAANLYWFDTVTFHTSNPAGSDYIARMTLDDTITNSKSGTGYGSAGGMANAILDINGGTYIQIYDAASYGSAPSHPPSYTQAVTLHVTDGQVMTFHGRLQISGTAEDEASVNVDAADTALFSLYSNDPAASYTTASGVTFVPEPASLSLLAAGALVLCRRGRRSA